VKDGLVDLNNQIKEVVGHSYSFVDVMIIFLREGLEVLLIVMTLTTSILSRSIPLFPSVSTNVIAKTILNTSPAIAPPICLDA
jgi:high-affinity Fe2+/Pb2+ permease